MESEGGSSGGPNRIPLAATFIICCLVVAATAPAAAQGTVSTDIELSQLYQQDAESTALSCLDVSKSEVTQRLNEVGIQQVNTRIQQSSDRIPNSVRNAMVGERVNINVESGGATTTFSVVVNQNAQIEQIEPNAVSDPTLRATTDCETIDRIIDADDRQSAMQAAISRGDITWEGLTTTSEVETSYGGKAVQTYTIVESGETGDVNDARDGFRNGLLLQ
ncbi:hypothetical protein [Halobellus salinisoli]|uniref:hypothetical protein n=1 Tax=Halobellus salinisoli TaxID=3108500 RepID=UPI003009B6F1